ncbi:hypothetical protein ACJMK2_004857 [Sinanodonta woodiana]|uniref:Tyr recombinase domain-containing protein n=1 Tax=Sinanodonta woodiana TaxID=1069815 RepID=A0ABD3VPL1_SINWO
MHSGFFGFLRCGEFTIRDLFDPTIHLCVGDVHFQQETAFLKLKSSKTDPFRKGVTIQLHATGRVLCPYSALKNFMQFRIHSSPQFYAPLLVSSTGEALSRVVFLNHMRLDYRKMGLDTSQYSGHSFRIGAATSAAAAHLEDHMIKVLDRWSSDCYSRYIRTLSSTIRLAQRAMAMDVDSDTL